MSVGDEHALPTPRAQHDAASRGNEAEREQPNRQAQVVVGDDVGEVGALLDQDGQDHDAHDDPCPQHDSGAALGARCLNGG